eukprot:scaffold18244_cov105-Isochrysis_galbana.AAC.2
MASPPKGPSRPNQKLVRAGCAWRAGKWRGRGRGPAQSSVRLKRRRRPRHTKRPGRVGRRRLARRRRRQLAGCTQLRWAARYRAGRDGGSRLQQGSWWHRRRGAATARRRASARATIKRHTAPAAERGEAGGGDQKRVRSLASAGGLTPCPRNRNRPRSSRELPPHGTRPSDLAAAPAPQAGCRRARRAAVPPCCTRPAAPDPAPPLLPPDAAARWRSRSWRPQAMACGARARGAAVVLQ